MTKRLNTFDIIFCIVVAITAIVMLASCEEHPISVNKSDNIKSVKFDNTIIGSGEYISCFVAIVSNKEGRRDTIYPDDKGRLVLNSGDTVLSVIPIVISGVGVPNK